MENAKENILRYGKILLVNNFNTERAIYTIRIILFEGKLFFHKMKNGELVELHNLDKIRNEEMKNGY